MKIIDLLVKIFIDPATKKTMSREGKRITGFSGIKNAFLGHFTTFRLYNPIGLAAAVVFITTIFKPWWFSSVYEDAYRIYAYPFILRHNLPPEGFNYVIETPVIGVIALLILLFGYLFLAFWGSTMAGKKGRNFLLATGIFMLLYCLGFYGSLWFATHLVDMPVVGHGVVQYTVAVDVYMLFLKPYYVAIGAGIACLASPLIHGLITIPLYWRKTFADQA